MSSGRRYGLRSRDENDSSPKSNAHKQTRARASDRNHRGKLTDDEEDDFGGDKKLYPSIEDFEESLGEDSLTSGNSSFDRSDVYSSPPTRGRLREMSPATSPTLNTSNISSSSYGSVQSPSTFKRSPIRPPEPRKQDRSPPTKHYKGGKTEESSTHSMPMGITCIVVIVCIAVCVVLWRTNISSSSSVSDMAETVDQEKQRFEMFETFKSKFELLQNTFIAQKRQVWQTSFGCVRHIVIEQNPTGPAVLLFLVPSDQQTGTLTAKCIAKKLIQDLNSLYNNSYPPKASVISVKDDLQHKNSAEDKLELDRKLQQNFQSGNKGVLIENLEELSPLAALLLHGMCDGDNAPFRDVLFVLLVQTPDDVSELSSVNYADKYLTKLWSTELDEDRIQPLLSRIANNVAVITAEESRVVESECHQ